MILMITESGNLTLIPWPQSKADGIMRNCEKEILIFINHMLGTSWRDILTITVIAIYSKSKVGFKQISCAQDPAIVDNKSDWLADGR